MYDEIIRNMVYSMKYIPTDTFTALVFEVLSGRGTLYFFLFVGVKLGIGFLRKACD